MAEKRGIAVRKVLIGLSAFVLAMVIASCSNSDDKGHDPTESQTDEAKPIQLTEYADEIGFTLTEPMEASNSVESTVEITGFIEEHDLLYGDYLWVEIRSQEDVQLGKQTFTIHIPIESGGFSELIPLHNGAGDYVINVRAPNSRGEDDTYYDVAEFDVVNNDEEVKRAVEYTQYGREDGIEVANLDLVDGKADGTIQIEGNVPKDHPGDMVIVQIDKDADNSQLILPIIDHTFMGEVPLYFGKGPHKVRVQTYDEEEELYFEAATMYADNQSDIAFAPFEKYNEYIDRGIQLDEPTLLKEAVHTEQAFPIVGSIDETIPNADQVTSMIVSVNHVEEDLESQYLIPVKDYQFSGDAYFRFGPGAYEVIISIPDIEQEDQSMFYYTSVAKVNQEVIDIEDERGQLPAWGIESDHPLIIEKAEAITAGLDQEREKAKAIYEFVAKHVAYDVEKAENDRFDIGDSALTALETGNGVCQDYAFLATGLLRAIEMDAHYVEGHAGERHAWIEVRIDNEWVVMDPTWGAGYVQDGEFTFHYTEDYFDPDPGFFEETHTRDGVKY